MSKNHHYKTAIKWTGNKGSGTDNYRNYERSHLISIAGKLDISGSSDPAFLGDKAKHNPEDLFLSSLSACHMLWYLHLCSQSDVIVLDYVDNATGIMKENPNGAIQFTEVTLNPTVIVADEDMITTANELHHKANELCFIANSVNFPIKHVSIAKTE